MQLPSFFDIVLFPAFFVIAVAAKPLQPMIVFPSSLPMCMFISSLKRKKNGIKNTAVYNADGMNFKKKTKDML